MNIHLQPFTVFIRQDPASSHVSVCVCMRFSRLTPLVPRQKDDEKKVESRRVYKTCEFVCEREKKQNDV